MLTLNLWHQSPQWVIFLSPKEISGLKISRHVNITPLTVPYSLTSPAEVRIWIRVMLTIYLWHSTKISSSILFNRTMSSSKPVGKTFLPLTVIMHLLLSPSGSCASWLFPVDCHVNTYTSDSWSPRKRESLAEIHAMHLKQRLIVSVYLVSLKET